MVTVVEGVTEVGVEGMNVGEAGEVGEHFSEALGDSLLGEFDLSHVERSNSINFVSWMDYSRSTSLGPGQNYIY